MPRTLKFLCVILGALLVADLPSNFVDSAIYFDADPIPRTIAIGFSLMAATITALLLALLIAFAKRVHRTMPWLQMFAIVNAALIVIMGAYFDDAPFHAESLSDGLAILRSWLEALTCGALAVVLRRVDSKRWFEVANCNSSGEQV